MSYPLSDDLPVVHQNPAATPGRSVINFTNDQVLLIKSQVAAGASDDELALFLYHCRRTGLDPLAKQIYCVFRWASVRDPATGKWKDVRAMTIQTGIDGFRLIAERTGKYAGQLGPFWYGKNTGWQDLWLPEKQFDHPIAAKIGVLRSDFKEPLWSVADWETYAQKSSKGDLTRSWLRMGPLMIAKCAEALALRRAFPQELSGLLSEEEMPEEEAAEHKPVAAPDVMRPVIEHAPPMPPVEIVTERSPPPDEPGDPGPIPEALKRPQPKPPAKPAGKRSIAQIAALEAEAREAADRGSAIFQTFWRRFSSDENGRTIIRGLESDLKKRMEMADAEIAAQAVADQEDFP